MGGRGCIITFRRKKNLNKTGGEWTVAVRRIQGFTHNAVSPFEIRVDIWQHREVEGKKWK